MTYVQFLVLLLLTVCYIRGAQLFICQDRRSLMANRLV